MKQAYLRFILSFLLTGVTLSAPAQTLVTSQSHEDIKSGIEQFLHTRQPSNLIRVQIEVGKIDPRLKLATCDRLDHFLPPNSREWGKITVGVRCLAPRAWTLYVATTVRAFGDYVSTTKALAAGQQISASDLQIAKGEISSFAPGLVTQIEKAVGQTLLTSQAAGVSLHQTMFKLIPLIQSGQAVKIFTQGAGFIATNDGIAINNAAQGQLAKARTSTGQIISGYATAEGKLEVR